MIRPDLGILDRDPRYLTAEICLIRLNAAPMDSFGERAADVTVVTGRPRPGRWSASTGQAAHPPARPAHRPAPPHPTPRKRNIADIRLSM